jgi:prophage antirepressor-like protein
MNSRFSKKFTLFKKNELESIRTVIADNGEIWFVGTDICRCLQIEKPTVAFGRLKESQKYKVSLKACSTSLQTNSSNGRGGARFLMLVSESGMYRLVMSAKKKEALEFQDWITDTVLPSIRKNGGYIYGQEDIKTPSEKLRVEGTIQLLAARVAKLQKRRHELIADNKQLKADNKHQKKELKERDILLDSYEDSIDKFYDDFAELVSKNKKLQKTIDNLKNPVVTTKEAPQPKVFYDREGFMYTKREDANNIAKSI